MYKIDMIRQVVQMTRDEVLSKAAPERLRAVEDEMRTWASDGADKMTKVTDDEVAELMAGVVLLHIATVAKPPPIQVGKMLVDVTGDSLKYIKLHLVQQALRLGRARAKIDRLETVIARLETQLKQIIEG